MDSAIMAQRGGACAATKLTAAPTAKAPSGPTPPASTPPAAQDAAHRGAATPGAMPVVARGRGVVRGPLCRGGSGHRAAVTMGDPRFNSPYSGPARRGAKRRLALVSLGALAVLLAVGLFFAKEARAQTLETGDGSAAPANAPASAPPAET